MTCARPSTAACASGRSSWSRSRAENQVPGRAALELESPPRRQTMVAQTKDFTQPTGRPDLDGALAKLRSKADEWARTSIPERLSLLRAFLDGYVAVADASVAAGLKM